MYRGITYAAIVAAIVTVTVGCNEDSAEELDMSNETENRGCVVGITHHERADQYGARVVTHVYDILRFDTTVETLVFKDYADPKLAVFDFVEYFKRPRGCACVIRSEMPSFLREKISEWIKEHQRGEVVEGGVE